MLQITKQVYFLDPIFTRRINRDRIFQINEKRGYEILAYDGEGSLIRCLLCPDQSAFVFQPGFLPHLRFGRKSIFRLYRRERKRLQAAEDFPDDLELKNQVLNHFCELAGTITNNYFPAIMIFNLLLTSMLTLFTYLGILFSQIQFLRVVESRIDK